MSFLRGILHGYSLSHSTGRLRTAALVSLALVGLVASSTMGSDRGASSSAPSADDSVLESEANGVAGALGPNSAEGGVDAGSPGDGVPVAQGGQGPGQDSVGAGSVGQASPAGSQAGPGTSSTSGSSSSSGTSSSSASSSSSSSSTSSSSTSTSGSPVDGLLPEDPGQGFGTGGLINEDQFVQDAESAVTTVTSTGSSVVSGVPLP